MLFISLFMRNLSSKNNTMKICCTANPILSFHSFSELSSSLKTWVSLSNSFLVSMSNFWSLFDRLFFVARSFSSDFKISRRVSWSITSFNSGNRLFRSLEFIVVQTLCQSKWDSGSPYWWIIQFRWTFRRWACWNKFLWFVLQWHDFDTPRFWHTPFNSMAIASLHLSWSRFRGDKNTLK